MPLRTSSFNIICGELLGDGAVKTDDTINKVLFTDK